ncbi:MAG: ABC transporter substrate-binding protein [Candidatus Saganbacteria bacterium]|nr:ABC transporter substrate-binding protein [Candidatus Saganbacteria bacterium]
MKIPNRSWSLVIGIFWVIGILVIGPCSFAQAKEYDGVWFLGFNMEKDVFNGGSGKLVRKAISLSVNKERINKIIGTEIIPTGIIPSGMPGFDPAQSGYQLNTKKAKTLMAGAGYSVMDKRLKNLTLLHTDGVKTIEIAKWIKRDLQVLGIDVQFVEVKYSDQTTWNNELKSGKYDMFLMGYKATPMGPLLVGDRDSKLFHTVDCPDIPIPEKQVLFDSYDEAVKAGYKPDEACSPKKDKEVDTYSLLDPLFHSYGEANFTFYRKGEVDRLLDQVSLIDISIKTSREEKFKEINKVLLEDPPVVPLFYITKL